MAVRGGAFLWFGGVTFNVLRFDAARLAILGPRAATREIETMQTMAFRAECQIDVARFLVLADEHNIKCAVVKWKPLTHSDIAVTIVTSEDIDDIRRVLGGVVDGHVMRETLAIGNQYGERTYR